MPEAQSWEKATESLLSYTNDSYPVASYLISDLITIHNGESLGVQRCEIIKIESFYEQLSGGALICPALHKAREDSVVIFECPVDPPYLPVSDSVLPVEKCGLAGVIAIFFIDPSEQFFATFKAMLYISLFHLFLQIYPFGPQRCDKKVKTSSAGF